jgi:hypothetical protein
VRALLLALKRVCVHRVIAHVYALSSVTC